MNCVDAKGGKDVGDAFRISSAKALFLFSLQKSELTDGPCRARSNSEITCPPGFVCSDTQHLKQACLLASSARLTDRGTMGGIEGYEGILNRSDRWFVNR